MFAEAPLCLYYMLVRVSDLAYYEFLVVTYEHAVLACGFATAQVVKSGVGERFFHSFVRIQKETVGRQDRQHDFSAFFLNINIVIVIRRLRKIPAG